jgi:hypothetical protein
MKLVSKAAAAAEKSATAFALNGFLEAQELK